MFSLMCNMFSAMWSEFYNTLRGLPDYAKGLIIFCIVMGALVCFIFAVKGSKKEKLIKNWFLFFVAIILAIIGVVFCFIM